MHIIDFHFKLESQKEPRLCWAVKMLGQCRHLLKPQLKLIIFSWSLLNVNAQFFVSRQPGDDAKHAKKEKEVLYPLAFFYWKQLH